MTGSTPPECPGTVELRELLSGHLPPDRAEAVEEHVETCPICLAQLAVLPIENPLVREMRKGLPAAAPLSAELVPLVNRLTDMHPTLNKRSGGSTEVAGIEEVVRSLAPSEGPGEIGRVAHYRVLSVIGVGGMGIVFRAEDTTLGREVALKVLRARRDKSGRARFLREARAMAALRHDHIAVIHQVGEYSDPSGVVIPFFAMELLAGEGLEVWKRREPQTPARWVARIGRQAAAGLAVAHAAGLVHRDVKPANLWLEPPAGWTDDPPATRQPLAAVGRVKLLDFGLVVPPAGGTGEVIGTPAYMAPEQVAGIAADARTDLFALGCVLYELCTGDLPYSSRTISDTKLPPLRPVLSLAPTVPPKLAALIEQMLAEKPADRPSTAKQVEQELARFELAESTPQLARQQNPRSYRPMAIGAALAATLLLVAWLAVRTFVGAGNSAPPAIPGTNQEVRQLDGVRDPVNNITFLADGRRAATVDSAGKLQVWDTTSGQLLFAHTLVSDGRILSVAASSDDTEVIVGTKRSAMLCDLATGAVKKVLPHSEEVWGVAFAPGGKTALTACLDGNARLWDLETAQVLRAYPCKKQALWTAVMSSDGRWVATGGGGALRAQSWDYTVRIWDAKTGGCIHELPGHTADVRKLAFTPDGATLVSGAFDGTVRVWDVTAGLERRVIRAHEAFVERVATLPDNRRALSVGGGQIQRDGTNVVTSDVAVRMWDLETGDVLFQWTGHRAGIRTLAVSPDGKHFLTGSDDRTVRLWNMP